jgi:hypothetical protein
LEGGESWKGKFDPSRYYNEGTATSTSSTEKVPLAEGHDDLKNCLRSNFLAIFLAACLVGCGSAEKKRLRGVIQERELFRIVEPDLPAS